MTDISNNSNDNSNNELNDNINFGFDTNEDDKNEENNNNKVPHYLKDEYITNYVVGRNHSECISNLFKIHNESVNAWTMIVSNLSVLLITIYIFMRTQFSKLYSFVFIFKNLIYAS